MSKSKGNVVAPDDIVARYGADTLRHVPVHGTGRAGQGVAGRRRRGNELLSRRLWRLGLDVAENGIAAPVRPLVQAAHRTIAKVTDDIERRFQFNTPISAVMELVNDVYGRRKDGANGDGVRFCDRDGGEPHPAYAPHIAEELWSASATSGSGRRGRRLTRLCSSRRRSSWSSRSTAACAAASSSGRPVRRRARHAREGASARAKPSERQGDPQDDRRAAPLGQPGRLITVSR